MDQLSVSSDKSVVSLGPGLRWGAVYDALDPYGVSVIGGRIPHVGVAGLILGGSKSRKSSTSIVLTQIHPGGFFHFSGEYGLAADNAKNFEVLVPQQPKFLHINGQDRLS